MHSITATAEEKVATSNCVIKPSSSNFLGRVQQTHRNGNAGSFQFLCELRNNTGGIKTSQNFPVEPDPAFLKQENILHADHVTAAASDLGDMGDPAGTITQA